MSTIKTWVSAMRLRTLPLALSSVLAGISVAHLFYGLNTTVAWLCVSTAVALQILSNFANDYGDFVKGTDNDQRVGNMRALQSGIITASQMRVAIVLMVILSLASGIALLYNSTSGQFNTAFLVFLLIGFAAIAAAIKYTVGKRAYGYSGLGDVAVFIFFGPVAVIGTFVLCIGLSFDMQQDWRVLLPACGLGLLSTAVLNTNNIRDIENDERSGKYTIPVKIGLEKARIYHAFLIVVGLVLMGLFMASSFMHWIQLLQIPAMVPIVSTLLLVRSTPPSEAYNDLLKRLSLGIFLLVVVTIITNEAAILFSVAKLLKQLPGA
jgi:1,4-dihydroxy-2-naphthoate octaprenyltransferase